MRSLDAKIMSCWNLRTTSLLEMVREDGQLRANLYFATPSMATFLGFLTMPVSTFNNNDVIKWKNLPCYWPFVRGIHRSPVNSRHKGQWRGALMLSLIIASINGWVNNCEAGDLRRHRAHYDVIVWQNAHHGDWLTHQSLLPMTVSGRNPLCLWLPVDCDAANVTLAVAPFTNMV